MKRRQFQIQFSAQVRDGRAVEPQASATRFDQAAEPIKRGMCDTKTLLITNKPMLKLLIAVVFAISSSLGLAACSDKDERGVSKEEIKQRNNEIDRKNAVRNQIK